MSTHTHSVDEISITAIKGCSKDTSGFVHPYDCKQSRYSRLVVLQVDF